MESQQSLTKIKQLNGQLRGLSKRVISDCSEINDHIHAAQIIYSESEKGPSKQSMKAWEYKDRPHQSKENDSVRNIATFNLMIGIYVNCFCVQIRQKKQSITMKEKQHLQRKQTTKSFMHQILYLTEAFAIFDEMLNTKGIYPDNFSLSQLLRGLKSLSQSQLISMQNQQQVLVIQQHLNQVFSHINYAVTRYQSHQIEDLLLNSLMDLCVRFQMPQKAIQIYQRVTEVKTKYLEQESLEKDHAESKESNSIFLNKSADQQRDVQNRSIQIGILIKAYGQLGELEKAYEIFSRGSTGLDHYDKIVQNDIIFGCLIDAFIKNNQIDRAEEIFEIILNKEAKQKAEAQLKLGDPSGIWNEIHPNTVIYTTMIKAYSQTFNLNKALSIYRVMTDCKDESHHPNIITYNSIIDCCVRCDEMDEAEQIFCQMQERFAATLNAEIKPDLITFSTLIKGHCRSKNIEQALILHEQMLAEGIKADEVLYNSLLDGCLKANQTQMALKCYQNMKKLKIRASNVTYSILAKIYQKMGDFNRVIGILDDMREADVKPGVFVYTCLIQSCMQVCEVGMAINLYEKMIQEGIAPDNVLYYTIITGCLHQNHHDYALNILLEALQRAHWQKGSVKPIFQPKQAVQISALLKRIMFNENNLVAIQRYSDLSLAIQQLDQHCYQEKPRRENKENHPYVLESMNILTDINWM